MNEITLKRFPAGKAIRLTAGTRPQSGLAGSVTGLLYGSDAHPQPRTLRLLDVALDNIDGRTARAAILAELSDGRCRVVNFANPHCLNVACTDDRYRAALKRSAMVLPDGSGIRIAACLRGEGLRENLNGTDLFPKLCADAAALGLSIYLLGARPGIAEASARAMQARFPTLRVAGCRDGYFDSTDEDRVIDEINRSGADLLFVALGVPMQELWLDRVAHKLKVRTALGVGGLFDFYSGRIPRAPRWLRDVGFEWVWRLMQEPRRMWRRYVIGNPLFLYRIWREHRRQQSLQNLAPWRIRLRQLAAGMRRWMLVQQPRAQRAVIRGMDVAGSGLALLGLSAPLALVALAIRLESPGPIFFSQLRVGRDGRTFRFWKFRSMYVDAEARKQQLMAQNEMTGGVIFKMKNDPRVTRVGRFIRRYSIDELPQLWNILRGDMAIVGPRPALPDEVAQYSSSDRRRLAGTPGLTCIWQVSGRSAIPFAQQVEMDVDYLHDATVTQNLSLILKTVPAVLAGRGAY